MRSADPDTGRTPSPTLARPLGRRSAGGARRIGALLIIALFVLAPIGTLSLFPPSVRAAPWSRDPVVSSGAATVGAPARTVWGHPGTRALPEFGPAAAARSDARTSDQWVCDSPPLSSPISNLGVNFSVQYTPGNGTGPAPLNLTWSIDVAGGGLAPYSVDLWILTPILPVVPLNNSSFEYYASTLNGSVVLNLTGIYSVYVAVYDATCTQASSVSWTVEAWGELGPDPLTVTATPDGSGAPVTITYAASTPALPSGWTTVWVAPIDVALNPAPEFNWTYYFPGNYSATACVVETGGVEYACAASPIVPVTSGAIVVTNETLNTTGAAERLTFYANLTSGPVLPSGTELLLDASNGLSDVENSSTNGSVRVTETVGCGLPWQYAGPSGVCVWNASLSLIGPLDSPNNGSFGSVILSYGLPANGTPGQWFPTISVGGGEENATTPFDLNVDLSVTNGLAPYSYDWALFGVTMWNGTPAPLTTESGNATGWNGSALALSNWLNSSGTYWFAGEVTDARGSVVPFDLPVFSVAPAPPVAPLQATAALEHPTEALSTGSVAELEVEVAGGIAPYTAAWSFGDGSFATSSVGVLVEHRYSQPGRYDPTVTVTDATGAKVTLDLGSFLVRPQAGEVGHFRSPVAPTPLSGAASPGPSLTFELLLLAVSGLAAVTLLLGARRTVRREIRAEGEALVADLPAAPPGDPLDPDVGR